MSEPRIAKLFKNGASQAVRLPAEFRSDTDEVYVSRDISSGDLVLSTRPGAKTLEAFFSLSHGVDVPDSFMASRPMNVPAKLAGVFDDDIVPTKRRKSSVANVIKVTTRTRKK